VNRNHEATLLFLFLLGVILLGASVLAELVGPLLNDVAKLFVQ
jgi:hypothetical protein